MIFELCRMFLFLPLKYFRWHVITYSQKSACELQIDQSVGIGYAWWCTQQNSSQQKKIYLLLQCNGMGEEIGHHRPIIPSNGNRMGI